MIIWSCDHMIRRPLLARGTKAAWLGLVTFLTISGHDNQLSGYPFMSLEGPNTLSITVANSRSQDPLHHQKSIYFQVCFQGPKNQKSGSQNFQKTAKIDSGIHWNNSREKLICALLSLRKPRFGSAKRRNFDYKIDKKTTWKQARTKKSISSCLKSKS